MADIAEFKKTIEGMIQKNSQAYVSTSRHYGAYNYTPEEINEIIKSSSILSQQKLSRDFFNYNNLYRRIVYYYATLLKYAGVTVPKNKTGKKLSNSQLTKSYNSAVNYIEQSNLPELLTRVALTTLLDGCYYGLILESENHLSLFDLPSQYCISRYRNANNDDLIEFNVTYFNSIEDKYRAKVINDFPKVVRDYYKQFLNGIVSSPWLLIPADMGFCIPFFDDGRPFFISTISDILQYEDAVESEREREDEEIRKILVQKIPHLNDGALVFEPEEALEMHRGAVEMMRGNKNLSVLTTYADVDAIVSNTSNDAANSNLTSMLNNVYAETGASPQIFAPVGSQAVPTSIMNDMALMMVFANKCARIISNLLSRKFGNGDIYYHYNILPVSYYNQSDFITDSLKLAQSGYSFLIPAVALGIPQNDLISVKNLENDVLKMEEILVPLSSSYTQSGGVPTGKVGAPKKPIDKKSDKTIRNEESLDRQGVAKE